VTDAYADGTYTLQFEQENPATPGQPSKGAKVLPIAVGLLNPNGDEVMPTTVLEMTENRQSFRFDGLAVRPIPSILRGFSAPVVLERTVTAEERAFLLAHDTDPFNKWEAGRALAKDVLTRMVIEDAAPGLDWLDALARVALDDALDPAFRALCLRLPSDDDTAQTLHAAGHVPDPTRIYLARRRMGDALAQRLADRLPALIADLAEPGPFSPDARAAGRRALRLASLSLLSRSDGGAAARAAFAVADNMTEEVGALTCLLDIGAGEAELVRFAARWAADRNVMDKWFAVQIAYAAPDRAAEVTRALTLHPAFDMKNPNRFRSVIGALSGHHAGFHHISGAGYHLVADWLMRLDPLNPQTAARMSTAFETWPRYDADRQGLVRDVLRAMLAAPGLSRDLGEMAGRMLGD
jgi:aminopeptidase N